MMRVMSLEIIHQEHEGFHLKSLWSTEFSQSLYDLGMTFSTLTAIMHHLLLRSYLKPRMFKALNHRYAILGFLIQHLCNKIFGKI